MSVAAGVGACGTILLLLLGRQVLDWYWPVLLFLFALVAGMLRARSKRLSRYSLAQAVDTQLGLEDRLATAIFFREAKVTPASLDTVERQAAERLHPEDLKRAMPIRFPRYGYACLTLLLAACALLALRYGILHTLDLNPPLARIRFEPFQPDAKVHAASKKSAIQERWEQQLKQLGLTPENLEIPDEKGIQPIQSEVPGAPEAGAPPVEQKGLKVGQTPQSSPEGGGEKGEPGDQSQGDTSSEPAGADGDPQSKGQPNKQQTPPQNAKPGNAGSQDGLMNKMRDALANLLNKMKSPSPPQDQQNDSSDQQQQAQQGKQQQGQQGSQSQGKQQGEGSPNQDQQGEDQQGGDKSPGDKTRASDKSSDRPGNQDAKSGMGQQDGEKAIREAQQLAAMGKLSEILGKRAQQITGEMTVEVSSGKQQLKTAWSDRKALHADTGAEVNRDEIPLAYQSYVQRYFEEIRKTPGSKPKRETTP